MSVMPIVYLEDIFHVGYMDKSLKKEGSYEGAGLSVSTEPSAWIRINPMTRGNLFELSKRNNQFLDFHAITTEQEQEIIDWGIQAGYIVKCPIYKFSYYDDEMDSELYVVYEEREKAEIEAEGYEAEVEEISGFCSTPIMDTKVMSYKKTVNDLDLLATIYVEDVLDIDGVYWFEELNVFAYSAPRGVIVENKLNEWSCILVEEKYEG